MALGSHKLLRSLELLENSILEHVSSSPGEEKKTGVWVPTQGTTAEEEARLREWEGWRALYEPTMRDAYLHATEVSRLAATLRDLDEVIHLDLAFNGSEQQYWRLIFAYRDVFDRMRENLERVLSGHNDITEFEKSHATRFKEFRNLHYGKENIFVVINYGADDDLHGIMSTLEIIQRKHPDRLQFHYASDGPWILGQDSILNRIMFYMIACSAGLVFFTESNAKDRGVEHNPNVCFEFGFMRGLGRRCGLIKHRKVPGFADMDGLIFKEYDKVAEVEDHVYEFLRDYVELKLN